MQGGEAQTAGGESLALRRRRFARIESLTSSLDFVREISPSDQMNPEGAEIYFRQGMAALDYIQLGLRAAEFAGRPRTVLDLPSGHGRVLRMLKAAFPVAAITACELDPGAVAFCAATFGATPVIGHQSPSQIKLPGSYDLIWVGSLLTHLDAPRWAEFLQLFAAHLEFDGVLIFTVHGRRIVDGLRRGERQLAVVDQAALIDSYDQTGFGYQDYVSRQGYGISLSSPVWVCRALAQHPSLELMAYTEGAWLGRQDGIVCRRRVDSAHGSR